MTPLSQIPLHQQSLSLDHQTLTQVLVQTPNLLIIQDLDGVCMGLVKDPLQRQISLDYVRAASLLDGHFYVLTNGEHIGTRGVNGIIERAVGDPNLVAKQGLYLPGLAGGGVQWQNRQGQVSHPGVTDAELEFLAIVPRQIRARLERFCQTHQDIFAPEDIEKCIDASVLDNQASPTANLNSFYDRLHNHHQVYADLQQDIHQLMIELLEKAKVQGLEHSFFVHYAPNLGRDTQGKEILRPAKLGDSGTTDFQFMIRGAIKEAGVLALLNRYYFQQTGSYPLGADFNVRQCPQAIADLLELVKANFDPQKMPLIVGVGDTVNSQFEQVDGQLEIRRGGSDRNFLLLIQEMGKAFHTGNIIIYVDSSQGEVKNRQPLKLGTNEDGILEVVAGPGDPLDTEDPLTLNVAFPQGHLQYIDFFQKVAQGRCSS
ncbi:MAG: glucosylglycerol 3-phosphatase [Arthrospira sp. SH-MAG29]|nr:glucosylglycerol 3-phosphatase [Arthrospira sp. SH-MAG29]MBS0016598.1 glucosylglycerol 3-phosphatase [Arthrospira sp. SH-MAG29]